MPKKLLSSDQLPTYVLERLRMWGQAIHKQRLQQRLKAADLCRRSGISEATLRRLEKGDPAAAVGAYLTCLLVLGIMDTAAPMLSDHFWRNAPGARVRKAAAADGDDDESYF